MPYKRKHPALVERYCARCGVKMVLASSQLAKTLCGDFKRKTGCIASTHREAQFRYRRKHPDVTKAQSLVWNHSRQIERAQRKIDLYVSRYGKETIIKWISPPQDKRV